MSKVLLPILACLSLVSCVTTPYESPEIKAEFKSAQRNVNECLIEQLAKLVQVQDDPNIVVQVAADRCEFTALQEAERLRKLNTNQNVVKGFNRKLTDPSELQSQAMNLLMYLIEQANAQN